LRYSTLPEAAQVDQIFERLERMIKSWVNATVDSAQQGQNSSGSRGQYRSGDPDLDDAMSELDDFLSPDKTETERRDERERREQKERERRERDARSRRGYGTGEPDQRTAVADAYRYLGLPFNTPFPEVKAAYKKLLLKNHPDRNSQTAYQLVETWVAAGKGPK
jgi:hypothetical protein